MDIRVLSPKQTAACHAATRRINIWEGAVRSGKTFSSIMAWLRFVVDGPAGHMALIGRTERTAAHNIIDPLTEILGAKRCRYVQNRGILELCGRRVYVVGANDERAEEKIRGRTLVCAYVDEMTIVPQSFVRMLLYRLSLDGARLYGTTNPDSSLHWLMVNYLSRPAVWIRGDGEMILGDEEALDLARFSFRLTDNETLGSAYVENLKRENAGLWRRRFVDGEWCIAAGAVYEMWELDRYVVAASDLPPIGRTLAVGVDYGDTAPTRGLLLGVSSESTPRLVVIDEWAPRKGLTQAVLSADLRRWIGRRQPEWIAIDPAAAGFRNQVFNDGVGNSMPAANAVLDGIRTVASLLATDRLIVSDCCTELLQELPSYCWDPKATARGKDEPVKQNDHSCDALRYAVASTRSLWGTMVPLTIPTETEEAA